MNATPVYRARFGELTAFDTHNMIKNKGNLTQPKVPQNFDSES